MHGDTSVYAQFNRKKCLFIGQYIAKSDIPVYGI